MGIFKELINLILSIDKNSFKDKNEEAIKKIIFEYLKDKELNITKNTEIGDLQFKIDLNIKYPDYHPVSKIGIEIKKAENLICKTAEMQRLLGQIYYYNKTDYKNNWRFEKILVLVIGDSKLKSDPKMKLIEKLVNKLNAKFTYFSL